MSSFRRMHAADECPLLGGRVWGSLACAPATTQSASMSTAPPARKLRSSSRVTSPAASPGRPPSKPGAARGEKSTSKRSKPSLGLRAGHGMHAL
jgi:hypothetical protein